MSLVSCHELSAFHRSSTPRVSAKPLKCDSYSLLPAMNLLGDIHLTHFCPLHAGRAPLFSLYAVHQPPLQTHGVAGYSDKRHRQSKDSEERVECRGCTSSGEI